MSARGSHHTAVHARVVASQQGSPASDTRRVASIPPFAVRIMTKIEHKISLRDT